MSKKYGPVMPVTGCGGFWLSTNWMSASVAVSSGDPSLRLSSAATTAVSGSMSTTVPPARLYRFAVSWIEPAYMSIIMLMSPVTTVGFRVGRNAVLVAIAYAADPGGTSNVYRPALSLVFVTGGVTPSMLRVVIGNAVGVSAK